MSLGITSVEFKKQYLEHRAFLELIDVREPAEFSEAHIKWSRLIPMGKLENKLDTIDWSKEVIFICRSGGRSMQVVQTLRDFDYVSRSLDGWVQTFMMHGAEYIESGS